MFNNRKNIKGGSVLWTSLAIFAVACSGVGTSLTQKLDGGQSQANLGLKVQAAPTASTPAALMKALSGSSSTTAIDAQNISVTEGQACVEEIKLKLPEGLTCADANFVAADNIKCEVETEIEEGVSVTQSEIKVTGPILFDLVTGAATPSLAGIALPSGAYHDIEFKFGAGCNLGGETSIVLKGNMKDSAAVDHPFEMNLEYAEDLKIESPTDIQVLEGETNGVFANLILNNWFATIEFVDCLDHGDLVADVNGVIQINKDTVATGKCDKIYEDVLDGIKDSMEFEDRDENDDGVDDHGVDTSVDTSDTTPDDNGGHGTDGLIK